MSKFGIEGLAITPPTLGRISIGKIKEHNGKRIPAKDDQITITTQFQVKREWIPHPLNSELRTAQYAKENGLKADDEKLKNLTELDLVNTKLRAIPVKMLFNDPTLNIRSEHTCFDKDGRTVCKGNGNKAKRYNPGSNAVETVDCVPTDCAVGKQYHCKPYTRLNLQIEGQDDELGSFVLRTAGWNTLRTLQAKLNYFYALANGKLAGLPLDLVMRGKSSAQSMGSTFFYLDLVLRSGYNMVSAVKEAAKLHKDWEDAGIPRDMFEEMARQGIANGMFEDSPDEITSVLEEFYPEVANGFEETETTKKPIDDLRSQLDSENEQLGLNDGSGDAALLAQLDVPAVATAE